MGIGAGAAAAIGAGVSGVAGLAGSALQSSATSSASSNAINAETQMYEQTRADLSPYNTAGQTATTQQENLLGLNGQDAANSAMSKFQASPGYQYQLSQGLKSVDEGAASQGMLLSGAAVKAEEAYGSNLANQDFSNYYNRLSGLSTTGEAAAAGEATSNTSTGSQLASTYTGSGNAQSSIYGNTTSGLSSSINNLLSNKDFQNWISGSGSGSPTPTDSTDSWNI